jgi:hypothetical protein
VKDDNDGRPEGLDRQLVSKHEICGEELADRRKTPVMGGDRPVCRVLT